MISFENDYGLPLKKGFKVEIRVYLEQLHQNKLIGCTELDLELYKIGNDNLVSVASRFKKEHLITLNLRFDDLAKETPKEKSEKYF